MYGIFRVRGCGSERDWGKVLRVELFYRLKVFYLRETMKDIVKRIVKI